MSNKKNKPNVSDISPRPPRFRKSSCVGTVCTGFDEYGYPSVRSMYLPEPFRLSSGRRYGSAPRIRPMMLSAPNSEPRPAIAKVSEFKIKPSPTVPAANRDLPSGYDFCVQKSPDGSAFLRFKDPMDLMHGSDVNVIACEVEDSGLVICTFSIPGTDKTGAAPLCEELAANKEPIPKDCCVKMLGDESGQIVCAGSAYDLLIVRVVATTIHNDVKIASVEHPDLPGGGARLPICETIEEAPDERPCCIEEESGLIVCPEGVSFPLNGMTIPLDLLEFAVVDGQRVARLKCGDVINLLESAADHSEAMVAMRKICAELGGYVFQLCTRKKPPKQRPNPMPEPKVPDLCCIDPDTGKLVCEGTRYHDLSVNVLEKTMFTNSTTGIVTVSVEHPSLPGGGARVPLCPRVVPEIPEDNPFDEEAKCRENWDNMVRDPARYEKCDKSWLDLLDEVKSCRSRVVPGRRGAAIKYASRPGIRGGAWKL